MPRANSRKPASLGVMGESACKVLQWWSLLVAKSLFYVQCSLTWYTLELWGLKKKNFANFKLKHMDIKSEADRSEYPEFGFVNVHLREVSLSHPIHCLLELLNCVYYVWITVGHETEHTSSLLWCSSTIGPAFLPVKWHRKAWIQGQKIPQPMFGNLTYLAKKILSVTFTDRTSLWMNLFVNSVANTVSLE